MKNANADHGFPYIYSLSSHHLHSALQLTSIKIIIILLKLILIIFSQPIQSTIIFYTLTMSKCCTECVHGGGVG